MSNIPELGEMSIDDNIICEVKVLEMTLVDKIATDPDLLIATLAIIVSFVAILIGWFSLRIQQKHNRLSVRPIGSIALSDYENQLAIRVKNAGIGPMIVKSIETSNNQGTKKEYPVDWMPSDIMWGGFRRALKNQAIVAGDSTVLLEFNLPDPIDEDSARQRDEIRSVLKNLRIRIIYTDVYDKEQPELVRSLDWFGRNIH